MIFLAKIDPQRMSARLLCACLTALLILCSGKTYARVFVLNTFDIYPYSTPRGTGCMDLVVKEAFRRIGEKVKIVWLPSERALINANSGIDDGDFVRVAGIEKEYHNLVMVPEKLCEFEFAAFAKSSAIKVSGWESLKRYNVGIPRGAVALEEKMPAVRSLTEVNDQNALFGMALGATLQVGVEDEPSLQALPAGLLTVAAAWCAALSIGYNTPALATGLCAIFLLSVVRVLAEARAERRIRAGFGMLLALATGWILVNFVSARRAHVYLDRPAQELTYPLDGLLPGGKGIRTNRNTQAFLADLGRAIAKAQGSHYAIVPDVAGWWARSPQPNPLLTDWDEPVDMGNPVLLARVTRSLEAQHGSLTVIVQKVEAFPLAYAEVPLPESPHFAVATYVRHHFRRVDETDYFALYR